MDQISERRGGTRSHRQSLPKISSGEKKTVTRASIPYPQWARHLSIRHRHKRNHATLCIFTSHG
jgi:hypothetical protein